MVGVSLGCISVVPIAVCEIIAPDPKENKHRLTQAVVVSPSPLLCGALLCSVSVLTVCCGVE